MTCFWDALRSKLNIKDNNEEFIIYLKKNNKKPNNVFWNNEKITNKQLDENFIHIRDFNEKKINNGYDCSTFDPFLILICDLYNVSIHHNFLDKIIIYEKKNYNKILNFKSNKVHFW